MVILGIETATMTEGIALVNSSGVLAEHRSDAGSTHAERLMPVILQSLGYAARQFDDLDGIAVSIGPGSFTGLRIGLSTAKGICLARNLPLSLVPTLDGLAYQIPHCRYPVCAMLDARRKEVYAAQYNTSEGVPERQTDYAAIRPERLLEDIDETTVFVGDGAAAYKEMIRDILGPKAVFAPVHTMRPSGSAVAFLGQRMLEQGKTADIHSAEPLYLRKPDAKIKAG